MPIINSWIFYLIDICDSVNFISGAILCASVVIFFITAFFELADWVSGNIASENDKITIKTLRKKFLVPLFVSLCVVVFMPSSDTVYKMVLADNVTYERVEMIGESVEDIYHDILNVIEKGGNDEEGFNSESE